MAGAENTSAAERFAALLAVRDRLRDPGGCPWDREQTVATAKSFLVEEAFEAVEAADREDWPGLCEELGDLLFQALFLVRIATDEGHFSDVEVLDGIREKLIRRHPHIFGDAPAAADSVEVLRTWGRAKQQEKPLRASYLDGLPVALPALVAAQRLQDKARQVGFDWPSAQGPRDKVHEELGELEQALDAGDGAQAEAEMGDLLFSLCNLARHLGFDAEGALRGANARFRRRFGAVEQGLAERGQALDQASLEEMDLLWNEAKSSE